MSAGDERKLEAHELELAALLESNAKGLVEVTNADWAVCLIGQDDNSLAASTVRRPSPAQLTEVVRMLREMADELEATDTTGFRGSVPQ